METLSVVSGHLLATGSGLTEGTIGHVSVLAWVPGCLAGSFGSFYFPLTSENNTAIYAQACKCDWTSCNTLKMQQVSLNGWWTYVNKIASSVLKKINKRKKSILFVLPDILMFNMRVLYYHDDYDYSCAILVYCCLNVTLFFYDMLRWKPRAIL